MSLKYTNPSLTGSFFELRSCILPYTLSIFFGLFLEYVVLSFNSFIFSNPIFTVNNLTELQYCFIDLHGIESKCATKLNLLDNWMITSNPNTLILIISVKHILSCIAKQPILKEWTEGLKFCWWFKMIAEERIYFSIEWYCNILDVF